MARTRGRFGPRYSSRTRWSDSSLGVETPSRPRSFALSFGNSSTRKAAAPRRQQAGEFLDAPPRYQPNGRADRPHGALEEGRSSPPHPQSPELPGHPHRRVRGRVGAGGQHDVESGSRLRIPQPCAGAPAQGLRSRVLPGHGLATSRVVRTAVAPLPGEEPRRPVLRLTDGRAESRRLQRSPRCVGWTHPA